LGDFQTVSCIHFDFGPPRRVSLAIFVQQLTSPANQGAVVFPEDQLSALLYANLEAYVKAPHFAAEQAVATKNLAPVYGPAVFVSHSGPSWLGA
jgi:hypothetical protein